MCPQTWETLPTSRRARPSMRPMWSSGAAVALRSQSPPGTGLQSGHSRASVGVWLAASFWLTQKKMRAALRHAHKATAAGVTQTAFTIEAARWEPSLIQVKYSSLPQVKWVDAAATHRRAQH